MFSVEQVQQIIDAAERPFDLCFWLMWEAGIRRGEVCALDVRHVDLGNSTRCSFFAFRFYHQAIKEPQAASVLVVAAIE